MSILDHVLKRWQIDADNADLIHKANENPLHLLKKGVLSAYVV
jgi:hypothetical protein